MHCTFTVRFPEVCARPSRPHRTVSRSASGLRDLSPGGTHPAHARAGRRHRARRGNGQISSAARPHVPFTITPAHVARAHRASDPRVRSTLGDPHRMCMRSACARGPCSNTNTVRDARTGDRDAYSLCAATRGSARTHSAPRAPLTQHMICIWSVVSSGEDATRTIRSSSVPHTSDPPATSYGRTHEPRCRSSHDRMVGS